MLGNSSKNKTKTKEDEILEMGQGHYSFEDFIFIKYPDINLEVGVDVRRNERHFVQL